MTVSVIVPVYNVEKYLDECVQSVISQTFTDWELILVDDGSADTSGAICDGYASEYTGKIRVIHQENKGLGATRNVGMGYAQGDYLAFLDADDCFEPTFLEIMVGSMRREQVDLCMCEITREAKFRGTWRDSSLPFSAGKSESDVLAQRLFYVMGDVCSSSCNKLFRRDIVERNDIQFSTCWAEDRIFVARYLVYCKAYFYHPQRLYYYRVTGGSLNRTDPWWFDVLWVALAHEVEPFLALGISQEEIERRNCERAMTAAQTTLSYWLNYNHQHIARSRLRKTLHGDMMRIYGVRMNRLLGEMFPGPLYLLPRLCFRLKWAAGFLFFTRLIKRIARGLGK